MCDAREGEGERDQTEIGKAQMIRRLILRQVAAVTRCFHSSSLSLPSDDHTTKVPVGSNLMQVLMEEVDLTLR